MFNSYIVEAKEKTKEPKKKTTKTQNYSKGDSSYLVTSADKMSMI